MNAMRRGQSQAFDRDGLAHAIRIESRVEQRQDAPERMADQVNRAAAENIDQSVARSRTCSAML